ncbi:hypothetical protein SLEP1_g27657 [Rubroshorea leprosula]|uniref:26S proteasome non-ATPase regulatory subunit 3 N-terminal TPR repeats domain-containing protein n=1 Tax=Rubroshorea leprosula TaxID=152421 RepID=A0AAV5JX65_9ROSI|nr:hypothetical protein SLEP1_g27657 [Rubroshorea leprosula]
MLAVLDLRCSIWWASFSGATAELLIPCASKSGSFLSTLDLVCLMRIVQVVRLTMTIQQKLKAPILSAFLNFALPSGSEAHSKLSSSLPKMSMIWKLILLPLHFKLLQNIHYGNLLLLASKACTSTSIVRLKNVNRRTIDVLAARLYFYYSLSYELLTGDLAEIRGNLLALHRIATYIAS